MDLNALRADAARDMAIPRFPDPPAPVRFNFDQGIVDEASLPYAELKAAMAAVIDEDGGEALQYLSHRDRSGSASGIYDCRYEELFYGNEALRREVARWIESVQAIPGLGPSNILLTHGTSAVFPLLATAFVNPGEAVLMEAMTLGQAEKAFRMHGARVHKVAIDRNGLVIADLVRQLEALKREGIRPKLLYTIPTFHLPTGSVLPQQRRAELLALAEQWNMIVVEDSVYSELRYGGERLPSLWRLDTSGLVLQVHGFAKILAPGIRLGWVGGHPDLVGAIAAVRTDFGVSQWMCRAMAKLMQNGVIHDHVPHVAEVCRLKRDVAVAAVRKHCGQWLDFEAPEGGMYLWLEMRETVDWEAALDAARLAGVHLRSGERFRPDGARYLRLAFCHASIEELEEGIQALGTALREAG